jgi:uncharacterized protein YcbX
MLFKVLNEAEGDPAKRYRKMSVDRFNEMALFATEIQSPGEKNNGSIRVTFLPPDGVEKTTSICLVPDVEDLTSFDVNLHGSETSAYRMPQDDSDWFSQCFGFEVVLVYLGPSLRPVLFDLMPRVSSMETSWLGLLRNGIFGPASRSEKITFADCSPYLVVSETSVDEVSKRLPSDQPMDVKKFRPNIVVSGAEEAWEEDYWAQLQFSPHSLAEYKVSLTLERNCVRCTSLNVDYDQGKPCINESGQVLKLLQRDRRVDIGSKYAPVFGRYSFLSGAEGTISVGDDVAVVGRNKERTVFGKKPSTTSKDATYMSRLAITINSCAPILNTIPFLSNINLTRSRYLDAKVTRST